MVSAVEAIRRNKTYFTARVAQMVLDGYLDKKPRTPADTDVPASRLTPRQREIVQLLAEGKSSKEVAVALNLSVKTAETHRTNVMRKLAVTPGEMTQADLAECLGLTPVHVNRVLKELREMGLLVFRGGRVTIEDVGRLRRIAEFSPEYLYLDRQAM